MTYKVIVIGAGVAGLSAIQKLYNKGIKDCLLLEAQSYLGGRVKTVTHGSHILEMGAQWIHGEDGNVVHALAKEKNLLDEDCADQLSISEAIFVREDSSIVDEEISLAFLSLMSTLGEEGRGELSKYKDSVEKYYTQKFLEVNKWGALGLELLDHYGRLQSSIDGTDYWGEASGVGSVEYKECPGNPLVNWKNGSETLVDYLKSQISDEVIRLNSPVKTVFWKQANAAVKVQLCSGEELFGEHIIVTPSLGVLKRSHEQLFVPKLPLEKIRAIEGLGFGVVDKIYLEFPQRWWGESCGFSLLRSSHSDPVFDQENWVRGVLGFFEVHKQPRILSAWLTGEAARQMEKCSLGQVQKLCVEWMRRYLAPRYQIPEPIWCDRSRWFSDPYVRGSYSFRSVTSEKFAVTAQDLARPLLSEEGVPVVCFAGEATHTCFYSTLHGAMESGWREADRILLHRMGSQDKLQILPSLPRRKCYDVIIIGAGASGLAAAKELEANGVKSVIILEACDRIGGRVKTLFPPSGGFLDLGAQWIHGQLDNNLYETSVPLGLIGARVSVDGQGDFYTDKGVKMDENLVAQVLETCENLKTECLEFAFNGKYPPPSIGHYLEARFEEWLNAEGCTPEEKKLKIAIFHWNMRWERIDNACDSLHQLSCKRWGEYKFCEGFTNLNPSRGMTSLLDRIKDEVKAEVKLQTEVVRIDYATKLLYSSSNTFERETGELPVVVTCRNGDVLEANHAVVTCSVGFLKEHLQSLFWPPLPSPLSTAISRMGFGVIDKIFLEFEAPFWDDNFTGIHLVWTDDQIPNFSRTKPDTCLLNGQRIELKEFWYRGISGFDPVYGHRATLCGWIGGPEAVYMESLPEGEVGNICVGLMRMFTNNPLIPDPIAVHRSQWASADFFLGSYSHKMACWDHLEGSLEKDLNIPVTATGPHSEVVPILTLSGEANSTEFFSTVHGAMQSGQKQAKHYIDFVKRQNLRELKSKL